jgi:hypothetical protein
VRIGNTLSVSSNLKTVIAFLNSNEKPSTIIILIVFFLSNVFEYPDQSMIRMLHQLRLGKFPYNFLTLIATVDDCVANKRYFLQQNGDYTLFRKTMQPFK